MSCCCEREKGPVVKGTEQYNGLVASDPGTTGIDIYPYRFRAPDGTVFAEGSGIWSRLVVSAGRENRSVSPQTLVNDAVEESSLMRLELFDGNNSSHNTKQSLQNHFVREVTAYDFIYQGWFNQAIEKWQVLTRTVDGPIALIEIELDGTVDETLLLDFWNDDGDILDWFGSGYDTKSYRVFVKTDHLSTTNVFLQVDAVFVSGGNSIRQEWLVSIDDGTVKKWRMQTKPDTADLVLIGASLDLNTTSVTDFGTENAEWRDSVDRYFMDSTDGTFCYGVMVWVYQPIFPVIVPVHTPIIWDFDGNVWIDWRHDLTDNVTTRSVGQYTTDSRPSNVTGSFMCLEAGTGLTFFLDDFAAVDKYATFDTTDGYVIQGEQAIHPTINIRYQPGWGKSSTGFVSLDGGGQHFHCDPEGVCVDLTHEDYFYYTFASDRAWGTKIASDPSRPTKQAVFVSPSSAGGGDQVGTVETVLIHQYYTSNGRWGDKWGPGFTEGGNPGAYALRVSGDDVVGVLFSLLLRTFWLRTICQAQCVVECRDEERAVYYSTCKTQCSCRTEDAPGTCTEANLARLTIHNCQTVTKACDEGGQCNYIIYDPSKPPGEMVSLGPDVTVRLVPSDCECNCPCPDIVLAHNADAGPFPNGSIVHAPCFYDPYFDPSCNPSPHDCLGMGSTMQLQLDMDLKCNDANPTLTLTRYEAGKYELSNYEVPDTDGCLFIDAEFECREGYGIAYIVVRDGDACSESYERIATHVISDVYSVRINDTNNDCCCDPCRFTGANITISGAPPCFPTAINGTHNLSFLSVDATSLYLNKLFPGGGAGGSDLNLYLIVFCTTRRVVFSADNFAHAWSIVNTDIDPGETGLITGDCISAGDCGSCGSVTINSWTGP